MRDSERSPSRESLIVGLGVAMANLVDTDTVYSELSVLISTVTPAGVLL